jgi:DisA bacterial checkpoint controller nucleotide-binding
MSQLITVMDPSLYLNHVIPQLQDRLATLHATPRPRIAGGYSRALLLLRDAALKFLSDMRLQETETDLDTMFWSAGPELRIPEWSISSDKRFSRHQITTDDGGPLDNIQQILLLELQAEVCLYLESLGISGDDLLDLSVGGFARFPIARMAMHVAGCSAWSDEFFWSGYILPAGVFNIRLLTDLERMLPRTYENEPVTTSAFILSEDIGKRIRWTNWVWPGHELFSGGKSGLRLSDGETTSFAFTFEGDFLGYFDTDMLLSTIASTDSPSYFRWKVLPDRTIIGIANGEPRIEYAQGSWRYINHNKLFKTLAKVEPSLEEDNQRVWELCLEMSRRREGALVLINKDPSKLLNDGVCQRTELNLGEESRLVEMLGPEPEIPALAGHVDLPKEVKPFLLDQFRGHSISHLSIHQLIGLARLDGAVVVNRDGILIGFGVILRAPNLSSEVDVGARTTAARAASFYGLAIKVSEDGPIVAFNEGTLLG